MAPTKAETLYDRMVHAFGEKQIQRSFEIMVRTLGRNLLDHLTDEAREELLRHCIAQHKLHRRFAAESRRHHARRAA